MSYIEVECNDYAPKDKVAIIKKNVSCKTQNNGKHAYVINY